MTTSLDLDAIAKRPLRYWNEDGLTEFFVGLMVLVPVCLFRAGETSLKGSPFFIGVPLVWALAIVIMSRTYKTLKERIIAPRGGYVALREPRKTVRVVGAVLVASLMAVAALAFPLAPILTRWGTVASLVLAGVWAACFVIGGIQGRQPHMLVLACVPLLVGLWIYLDNPSFMESSFRLCSIQGGALALSGAIRLRKFLKANPRIDAAE